MHPNPLYNAMGTGGVDLFPNPLYSTGNGRVKLTPNVLYNQDGELRPATYSECGPGGSGAPGNSTYSECGRGAAGGAHYNTTSPAEYTWDSVPDSATYDDVAAPEDGDDTGASSGGAGTLLHLGRHPTKRAHGTGAASVLFAVPMEMGDGISGGASAAPQHVLVVEPTNKRAPKLPRVSSASPTRPLGARPTARRHPVAKAGGGTTPANTRVQHVVWNDVYDAQSSPNDPVYHTPTATSSAAARAQAEYGEVATFEQEDVNYQVPMASASASAALTTHVVDEVYSVPSEAGGQMASSGHYQTAGGPGPGSLPRQGIYTYEHAQPGQQDEFAA